MAMAIGAVMGATPASAATSPPERWGAAFCGALGQWSDTITKGATEIQSSGSTADTAPTEGKAIIVGFLGGFADATRGFYRRMKRAGEPDTGDGARIHKAILRGIAGIEDRIGDLQGLAQNLPTDDSASYQASVNDLVAAFDTVSTPFDRAMSRVAKLDEDNELSDSLRTLKACRKQFG